ncbi:MAG: hypothetical protein M1817_006499 [Caeruleum heppii]|nr:MAG: hypothetical protein M1817_006499 [Caeruleum heppii]
MILFMLGFFVTLIQAVRIFSIKNLKQYIDSHNLILWSIVEVNLGITLTCIPTLAPLFSYYRGSVHAQTTSWSSTSATRKGSRKSTSPRSHVYNRSVSHQAHDRDKSANLDYTLSDMDSRAHLPGGNLPLSSTRTDTVRHGHCHTGVVTAGKMSNNKMGIAMRLGKEGAVGIPRDGGSEEGLVRPEDGIMKTREVLVERQDRSPGWNVV